MFKISNAKVLTVVVIVVQNTIIIFFSSCYLSKNTCLRPMSLLFNLSGPSEQYFGGKESVEEDRALVPMKRNKEQLFGKIQ